MTDTDRSAEAAVSRETGPAPPIVDRTISPIAGRFGSGRAGKAITLAALTAGCGVLMLALWRPGATKPKTPLAPAQQIVAFEPAKTELYGTTPTLAHPGADAPILDPAQPAPGSQVTALAPNASGEGPASGAAPAPTRAARLEAMRAAPILAFSQADASAGLLAPGAGVRGRIVQGAGAAPTELDQLRQGSAIGLTRASRLPDRKFLIAAGASIPCTLLTAMDTSTPGYVSCLIGQDVYSDNGAVVLMEKGAKVLGEYRSGMRQGQKRLFVLWTRAVTPSGVAIGLASPASDALGRAGFDGAVDTHFWERFGGALLLSVVDDTSSAIASRTDPNATVTRVPSDAAAVALQNSINIPPSLTKPQGSQVAIFVAQDLDFSGVYALKAR